MNQRAYLGGRPTLLDVAKSAVETFVKVRPEVADSFYPPRHATPRCAALRCVAPRHTAPSRAESPSSSSCPCGMQRDGRGRGRRRGKYIRLFRPLSMFSPSLSLSFGQPSSATRRVTRGECRRMSHVYVESAREAEAKINEMIFFQVRQRSPESRGDRYMLLTFEDPPQNIKVYLPSRVFLFRFLLSATFASLPLHVFFHVVSSAYPCDIVLWKKRPRSHSLHLFLTIPCWVRFA